MAEYLIQDTTLDAIANAINAKTGGSSAMTPAEMVMEIAAIPSGGGSSGYAKKTGSFVLASDYTFSNSIANGYSGSLLVDTGLSKIAYVTLWVEEWLNQTLGDVTSAGLYTATNMAARVGDNTGGPPFYIPAVGVLKNNATNYYFNDIIGGIVTHLVCPNDVPEGSFGFRCRSGAYGIKAGYTVRWEALGEE